VQLSWQVGKQLAAGDMPEQLSGLTHGVDCATNRQWFASDWHVATVCWPEQTEPTAVQIVDLQTHIAAPLATTQVWLAPHVGQVGPASPASSVVMLASGLAPASPAPVAPSPLSRRLASAEPPSAFAAEPSPESPLSTCGALTSMAVAASLGWLLSTGAALASPASLPTLLSLPSPAALLSPPSGDVLASSNLDAMPASFSSAGE
jgi:hypothetical protein